jgi:hypothetical protein
MNIDRYARSLVIVIDLASLPKDNERIPPQIAIALANVRCHLESNNIEELQRKWVANLIGTEYGGCRRTRTPIMWTKAD